MFKNHVRLLTAATAVSFALLAGGAARAGDDLKGTWTGTYESPKTAKGGVPGSKITILPNGAGGFGGDWDGYVIYQGKRDGNKLTWTHFDEKSRLYYEVRATLVGGQMQVEYDVYDGSKALIIEGVVSASPAPGGLSKKLYSGHSIGPDHFKR
jgi:hypothetical protein